MGMKLLTPVANKDARQVELSREVIRAQEVTEITKKVNMNRAKAELEFNEALARFRKKWEDEEEAHAKRLKEMEEEVKPLEERKKQALIPIEVYKAEADTIMLEAREILGRAKEKEAKADEMIETLEEKLTAVGDREQAVEREEKRQTIAKQGIETQQEATRVGVKNLSQAMVDFEVYKNAQEASITERKKEVTMAEISFKAKTDKFKRDNQALKMRERQVNDMRETLIREKERMAK